MNVLMAEDMAVSRRQLECLLTRWGHQVTSVRRGDLAIAELEARTDIDVALLDWMMPGLDGVEVCRWIKARAAEHRPYVILLTARVDKDDVVAGLGAGADDYIVKPFQLTELRARLEVGARTLALERSLRAKIAELEAASRQLRRLEGLLPICMYCKQIRDDAGKWHRLETFIMQRTTAVFSHGMCQTCAVDHFAIEPG